MAGLIPLMLTSGNRSSYVPPPKSHTRSSSTGSTPMARPRASPTKRLSHSAPVSLPVLPYTLADWKRTISDIKRQLLTKRYRACAARCNEIITNVKDMSRVEPIYLIYLHFYAATAMELCARTLPPVSPSRPSLLQQARTHFDRAAALIDAAEDSVVKRARNGSVSSMSSSCLSPTESLSSRAATPETRLSSPTNSVCSFEDLAAKSQSQPPTPVGKRVKKVSFSLPPPPPEPVMRFEPRIRPDSPTLGFDDEYFHSGITRQDLPEPPKMKFEEVELPLQLQTVSETEQLQLIPEDDAFLMERSIDRYCENLSGLRAQLARHSSALDDLLSPKEPSFVTSPVKPSPLHHNDTEEMRKMDRQARIERLRKTGWQRKRFDPRRYEELCETVMSELS